MTVLRIGNLAILTINLASPIQPLSRSQFGHDSPPVALGQTWKMAGMGLLPGVFQAVFSGGETVARKFSMYGDGH